MLEAKNRDMADAINEMMIRWLRLLLKVTAVAQN